MTQSPASVLKQVRLADEPFVLPQGEPRPAAAARTAASTAASTAAPVAPLAAVAETAAGPAPRITVDPERVRQAAYEEGFEAGARKALAQAKSEVESIQRECQRQIEEAQAAREALDAQEAKASASARAFDSKARLLDEALHALREIKAEQMKSAEDDLVALSFGIASQVFEQAALNPELLLSLVRRAIGELGQSAALTIHVHPQDLDWLKDKASSLKWLADPAVELGGCIVHTEQAALDARLEQQVQSLRQRLMHIRNQRKAPSAAEGATE